MTCNYPHHHHEEEEGERIGYQRGSHKSDSGISSSMTSDCTTIKIFLAILQCKFPSSLKTTELESLEMDPETWIFSGSTMEICMHFSLNIYLS